MELDEEDFIFYGTPIEREEDTSARKRKAVADAGSLRSLPAWKQEVRDEEGRKRFHGAFKGGYSAGYYNTVGSKEGWSPQPFASSRKNRAEVKKQNIYNFLDEEDIKDMGGQALETSLEFDTFGFTAAELARKQAEREQKNRTSAIPGPIPNEIIVPASNSVGVKLLLKMGWRRGHSINMTQANSLYGVRREARKALLAFSGNVKGEKLPQHEFNQWDTWDQTERDNDALLPSQITLAYVINAKKDLYGLGFDPFKHAPEFKERKMLHELRNNNQVAKRDILMKGNFLAPNSGKYASGFGIGALEELDIEDEDIYASGFELIGTEVQEDEPSRTIVDDKLRLDNTKKGFLPGFKVASGSDYNIERFNPPVIPPDFKPHHKFASPLETMDKYLDSQPLEVPPPDDDNLRVLIDGFAKLVARCGKLFEDLSKVKNRSNPLFSFLTGGNGHNYYARKLWEANQRHADLEKRAGVESVSSDQKMTASTRGKVLGERPLDRSSNDPSKSDSLNEVVQFQTNLSDTFTQPAAHVSISECAKAFKDNPAKQERFEIFLKDKYQGGLRSLSYGITGKMSEAERACEKLDFEAAAETIMKGGWKVKGGVPTNQHSIELSGNVDERLVSSVGASIQSSSQVEEKLTDKILPKREEFQWRPSALLCKRFDIVDPFIGKPPPAPRPRSKMDTLIFLTDSVMGAKDNRIEAASRDSFSGARSKDILVTAQLEDQNAMKSTEAEQYDADLSTSLQRPVDLYKAIFSDESDYEDDSSFNSVVEPEKRSEGANTTLNRLIAGDFLESLVNELGLEVPVDPSLLDKPNSTSLTMSSSTKTAPAIETSNAVIKNEDVRIHESQSLEITASESKAHQSNDMESVYIEEGSHNNSSSWRENMSIGSRAGRVDILSFGREEKEVIKKKEQHRKHQSSRHSSDTDSSGVHGYHNRSRSEKKASSKKKQRKHERQYDRKNSRAHSRYSSDGSDSEYSDDDRRDRKSRDRRRHSGRSKADVGRKYL